MAIVQKTVFISYRRRNVPWALAIHQNLKVRGFDVFFDFMSIASGDFEQVITENIAARAHFLVLLTPSALDGCEKPGDWLRREIEMAVDTRRNIVPIMLEGFDFGAPESVKYLTGKLENLQHYNGLRLPADYFEEGMTRLCERYLNVPREAVIHPLSQPVEREVNRQQAAAAQKPIVTQTELTAQEWFERGFLAVEINEQIRCYNEAIQRDPKYADAYNNRGNSYANLRQHERAIQNFDKAIQINPEFAEAYANRGNGYAELSQHERAIQDFDKAIEINSVLAGAYSNRGYSYAAIGQHERAFADFDKAIEIDPEYATAYSNRGYNYAIVGQHERAVQDYNKAIEIDPEFVIAYSNRGYSYASLGQHECAIQDYDTAIQINPEYTNSYYNKACSFGLQGKAEDTVVWLREALIRDRDEFYEIGKTDADFDLIRGEKVFKALMDEFEC